MLGVLQRLRIICPIALLFLSACSSSELPEPAPLDLEKPKEERFDLPEQALLDNAKRLYSSGLYSIAREYFSAVRDNFPLGGFGEFAEIKIADCYFFGNEFVTAAALYEEFAKNHPSSTSHPYALLMTGLSLQRSAGGVGRDIVPVKKAITFYEKLRQSYPDSPYARSAEQASAEALSLVAAHEQRIIEYYQGRNPVAASARTQRFESDIRPALLRAQSASTSAPATFADAALPLPAQALVHRVVARSEDASTGSVPSNARAEVRMQKLYCKNDDFKQLYIVLSKDLPDGTLKAKKVQRASSPIEAPLVVKLPLSTNSIERLTYDCFGSGDVTVDSDGTLRIASAAEAEIMLLRNPSRILLTIR